MKIGILAGGKSPEHEISIITALEVYEKLDKAYFLYLTKNNDLYYYKKPSLKRILANKGKLIHFRKKEVGNLTLDLIVLANHGKFAEDGHIQAILDFYELPYIGSNMEASCLGMDKELSDLLLRHNNIKTVNKRTYFKGDYIDILNYPVIIKPSRSGSSLGISVVKKEEELGKALNLAYLYDNKIIVEDYLANATEYALALYKTDDVYTSKIEKIKTESDFFNYNEKYKNRKKRNSKVFLTDSDKIKVLEDIGKQIYKVFELEGIIRIDFLEYNEKIYVNEINTIPGSLASHLFEEFGTVLTNLITHKLYEVRRNIKGKENVNEDIYDLINKSK